MENYKPNSHRFKEEQKAAANAAPSSTQATEVKKVEKVVKGTVKTRKKGEMSKLSEVFISEDLKTVTSRIFADVLVPAVKNAIVDMVTDGVNMIFLGKTARGHKSSSEPYVSYRDYSKKSDYRGSESSYRERSRFDIEEIEFESRGDAEAVLDQMGYMIERYGVVTVADLYDMADRSHPYTSNKYGWTSIRGADIVRVRGGGYIIKMSRPMPID